MDAEVRDAQLRQAAFGQVNRLAAVRGGTLDSTDLAIGFEFEGERIPLLNPQRGIFKPRQMAGLLSIRTVFPRQGARVWYDDQREAHRQIYAGDDVVEYAFMGTDPDSADNRWLRAAMQDQIPLILFPWRIARSRNRLNVTIFRARCLAVIVASPKRLATSCSTIEQMKLVNAHVGRRILLTALNRYGRLFQSKIMLV